MKNEEKKAMIHARAQAQVERENHELRMEQTRAEAKEKSKAAEKIAKINSEHYWAAAGRLMRNEDGMLTNMTKAAVGLTVCGLATYFVMREAMRQVGARVMKPSLGSPRIRFVNLLSIFVENSFPKSKSINSSTVFFDLKFDFRKGDRFFAFSARNVTTPSRCFLETDHESKRKATSVYLQPGRQGQGR